MATSTTTEKTEAERAAAARRERILAKRGRRMALATGRSAEEVAQAADADARREPPPAPPDRGAATAGGAGSGNGRAGAAPEEEMAGQPGGRGETPPQEPSRRWRRDVRHARNERRKQCAPLGRFRQRVAAATAAVASALLSRQSLLVAVALLLGHVARAYADACMTSAGALSLLGYRETLPPPLPPPLLCVRHVSAPMVFALLEAGLVYRAYRAARYRPGGRRRGNHEERRTWQTVSPRAPLSATATARPSWSRIEQALFALQAVRQVSADACTFFFVFFLLGVYAPSRMPAADVYDAHAMQRFVAAATTAITKTMTSTSSGSGGSEVAAEL